MVDQNFGDEHESGMLDSKFHNLTSSIKQQLTVRYTLEGKIGSGMQGNVYRAKDEYLNQQVAIKLLHSAGESSKEQLQELRQEYQLLQRVMHPNIVTYRDLDYSQFHKQWFIKMDLINGSSLRRSQASGAFPHSMLLTSARTGVMLVWLLRSGCTWP